ncbi:MAG: hypothetical protein JW959_06340 [Pirellulales bacterium]|nr:hypothetical protein [Pirellulales bacterium]
MSSGMIAPPPLPAEVPLAAPPSKYEGFIDQRIRQTRRQIRTVDVAAGLAALAAGAILYLFAAALADHWLLVGGLGVWGRWLLWLALVGAGGAFFTLRILPPLVRSVNPVFAASTIEQSRPTLRNSLVNFLFLRGLRCELAPPVYNALERRAADDLSQVPVEASVDRTRLIRISWALAVVLALFLLYFVVSPKDPLRSAARVLLPWSDTAAPTRVTIEDLRPGDTAAFHGEFITVSAEVAGLSEGEIPLLIYSTADGQSVDQQVPMTLPEGRYRHECRLPPSKLGFQQAYTYHLSAGDCRTREYKIEVRNAPAIVVDRVVYRYPGYTGLADLAVDGGADLRAIEGTKVTIHATANAEIKPGSAEIDLGCTGRGGVRMSSEKYSAEGDVGLRLNSDGAPPFDCYQLRFSDLNGNENLHPARHGIEVVRDLPPEAKIVEPQQERIAVPENGRLTIRVRAADPDFALRRVLLKAVRADDDRGLSIPPLLERLRPEKGIQGEHQARFDFEPKRLGLKAGDRVQYWAEAEDNKEPMPNQTATGKKEIVIEPAQARQRQEKQDGDKGDRADRPEDAIPPQDQRQEDQPPQDLAKEQSPQDQQQPSDAKQDDQQQKESSNDKQGGEQGDQSGGEQGDQQSDAGEQGDGRQDESRREDGSEAQSERRVDPEAEPGDAMQKIIEDIQRQQEKQESQNKNQNQNQQPDSGQKGEQKGEQQQQPSGEKQESRDRQSGDQRNQPDGQPSGAEQTSGDKQEQGPSGGEKANADQPSQTDSPREKGGSEQGEGTDSAAPEESEGSSDGQREKTDAGKPDGEKSPGEPSGGSKKERKEGEQGKSDKETGQGQREVSDRRQPTEESAPGGRQPGERDMPGEGKKSDDRQSPPLPQEEAAPRERKRPEKTGQAPGERKEGDAQSPSIDEKESDSKGDTAGDRKGGGEQGGGQQSDQPGVGGPGANAPADQGASKADEPGVGETGFRPGEKEKSETPTGSEQKAPAAGGVPDDEKRKTAREGSDSDATRQTDGKNLDGSEKPADPSDKSGSPRDAREEQQGGKGFTGGGSGKAGSDNISGSGAASSDRANLDYARRQTALALEHLRDQLAEERSPLLERLGWTKEEAKRFLERWERMRRAATRPGAAGEAAKKQFDEALQSLGLRPGATDLKSGGVAAERSETQRDAGRFAPPPQWADQFRAYTRGVSEAENKKSDDSGGGKK